MPILLFLFPAVISVFIIKNRGKKEYKELLLIYPIYCIIINCLSLTIVQISHNGNALLLNDSINYVSFNIKYLVLSSLIAIIIPFIKEFIYTNIKLEVIIRKENKNEKTK